MAEQKETLVFEINVESYLKSLQELNVQIVQAKENQKELAAAAAAGDVQAGKNLASVNAFLKTQQQEYRNVQKALVGFTEAQKANADVVNFANNSVKTNRALLAQLTEQYNTLNKAGRERLAPTIKAVSDELKKQEGAIGDTRRNVGNYTESLLDAAKGLRGIGGAIDPIRNLGAAFTGAGGGVKGFSAALATTGLPLIIAGVNLLINAFASFKPIVDAVEDATDALGATFRALIGGNGIAGAIRVTNEYRETLRDLEDTQAGFNLQQQAYLNQIDQLIIKSKDRTKSEAERIKAVKDASKVEETALKESTERIDRELDKLKTKVIEEGGLRERELNDFIYGSEQQQLFYTKQFETNKSIDQKDLQRLQELALERSKLFGASGTLQERLKNRENALTKEIQDDREKETQKQKAEQEKRIAERQKYLDNLEKLEEETLLNDRQRLEKSFQQKIDSVKVTSQREADIVFALEQSKQDALDKFDQEIDDKRKERAEKRFVAIATAENSLFADSLQKRIGIFEIEFRAREKQLKEEGATEVLIAQVKANEIKKITENFNKEVNDADKKAADEREKIRKEETRQQEEQFKYEQELTKARIDAGATLANSLIGFIGDIAEATGANAAFQKALAIFDIGVKTAVALAGAIQQAQSVPFPANIAAIAAGIAAVLGGIGAAVSTLSKAGNAPKPPKFAEGGGIDIDGAPHSLGGTPIHVNGRQVAEAERGEKLFIMKKSAAQKINMLSAFNQMFGGKSWNGSPVSFAAEGGRIQDGGFTARSARPNNELAQLEASLTRAVKSLPNPVVGVKEITRVNNNVERSVIVQEL